MWFGHDIEVSNASSGVRHSVVQGGDRPGLAAKSKLCRVRGNMRKPFYSEDQVAQIDSRLQPLVFSGQSRESGCAGCGRCVGAFNCRLVHHCARRQKQCLQGPFSGIEVQC